MNAPPSSFSRSTANSASAPGEPQPVERQQCASSPPFPGKILAPESGRSRDAVFCSIEGGLRAGPASEYRLNAVTPKFSPRLPKLPCAFRIGSTEMPLWKPIPLCCFRQPVHVVRVLKPSKAATPMIAVSSMGRLGRARNLGLPVTATINLICEPRAVVKAKR